MPVRPGIQYERAPLMGVEGDRRKNLLLMPPEALQRARLWGPLGMPGHLEPPQDYAMIDTTDPGDKKNTHVECFLLLDMKYYFIHHPCNSGLRE